jgi:hypothetical protein
VTGTHDSPSLQTGIGTRGENTVANIEQIELEAYRDTIISDVKRLVEKYRAIFDWDVPDIDQKKADRLILAEIRKALDNIDAELLSTRIV